MDLLKTLRSYGDFKLRVSGFLQIFSDPLASKLCVEPQTFWRCKNVLEVLYHRAKFGGAGILPVAGRPKTLSLLSVCLFVRHAFERERLCAWFRHEGGEVQKWFWCRWIGFVVVHSCSISSERELTICYRPFRLSSVCLSVVCNARAPYLTGWNFPQYFYGI